MSNPTTITGNWMTDSGAIQLAKRLETFWRSKGSTEVKVWTEPVNHIPGSYLIIRSNLVNGMPPDFHRVKAQGQKAMQDGLLRNL